MPRYTRVLLRIFPTGAKRFRVTPRRPQELISRRQLYGDRCFGNKSSGITEAHSLPRVWQTRCQNAMEYHGICLFHSIRLSLSLSLFLSFLLSSSVLSSFSIPVEVLLSSCFVSGTIFNSYGAQSKLPMNINARGKSSQLKVAHRHFHPTPRGSQRPIVALFLTKMRISTNIYISRYISGIFLYLWIARISLLHKNNPCAIRL